ncbi:MAG TPA: PKD domain-containing protein [Gemmatimonadaceae bacterium]|nr:PKD domain-containing protein [Gemmatimonadaceae bacterium]
MSSTCIRLERRQFLWNRGVLQIALAVVSATFGCTDVPTEPASVKPVLPKTGGIRTSALTSSLPASVQYVAIDLSRMTHVYAINDDRVIGGDRGGNGVATIASDALGYVTVGRLDGTTACCSSFNDINASGDAVGSSHTASGVSVMTWSLATQQKAGFTLYGRSYGQAINDAGDIVGGVPIGPSRALYKAAGGNPVELQLAPATFGAYAFDINSSGAIVGHSESPIGLRAIRWATPESVPVDLGTLGGMQSVAWATNESHDVVGKAQTASGEWHAFVWTDAGGMVDLNSWPNACPGESEAFAINNNGVIVGRCQRKAALWTALEGMRILAPPFGAGAVEARDINNNNEVVGMYEDQQRGVLWRVAPPPLARVDGPYTGLEGSPISMSGASSIDPTGGGLTYSWAFGDPNAAGGGTAFGATPTHTYADEGTYTVTLTVKNAGGVTHSTTTSVVVTNVQPSLLNISSLPEPIPVGTQVSITGGFSDPGIVDAHTVTFDWNAEDTPVISAGLVTGTGAVREFTGTHNYTQPGVYAVKVTINDGDGGTHASLYQYVVVFDPTNGFVTGAGWIDSPDGAHYLAPEGTTGRAYFGFVSRYEKGRTTPSGKTRFEFKTMGLDFQSSSYDWMVVSGPKVQYQGTGTINGEPGYRFYMTVRDGALANGDGVDRFRIRIWDEYDTIIYDNQRGDSVTGDATTVIGGGSIVIHSK